MKRISSTLNIPPGSVLRIYKKGFGYARVEINESNDRWFGVSAKDDFFSLVKDGDLVDAYYWLEDVASYEFSLTVIGRITVGEKILFFGHTDKISASRERKCLSTGVEIPIRFFIFDPKRLEKRFTSEKVYYHNGTVIELSDRDSVIRTPDPLPDNIFIYGHIVLDGRDIELIGKVEPVAERQYHVAMTGITEKDRHKILEYVYRVYRE